MSAIVFATGCNLLADARNRTPNEIAAMLITRHIGSLITTMATSTINPMTKVISARNTKSIMRLIVRLSRLRKNAT
jgi:high-affinity K+ transport system ATPase subunit B